MSKKYLSLEEAAEFLNISVDELKELREKGEIRGFADRATWKFRSEDLEQYARSAGIGSDASIHIGGGDSDMLADQDTIVRSAPSDSSVRLVVDDDLAMISGGDSSFLAAGDSDSDVRLEGEEAKKEADSDSDVRMLADSDSDVRLLDEKDKAASDSDVRLISDSRKNLDESDSAISIMPEESGALSPSAESDSDVRVMDETVVGGPDDSGPANSGISLEAHDSGISLELEDSGIALVGEEDSGISLLEDEEFGATGAGDSGIALDSAVDSGLSLESGDDVDKTAPLSLSAADDELDETQLEVPAVAAEEDSDFELSGTDFEIPAMGSSDTDTGVVVFDDDKADDFSAAGAAAAFDDYDEFASPDFDEFDAESDLDVAPDIMGEDEGLDDLDVFEADDAHFSDTFQSSGSQAEFAAPAGAQYMETEPAEWGVGSFLGVMFGTALMGVCAIVMFDLVRSLWGFQEPLAINSFFLNTFGDLFK